MRTGSPVERLASIFERLLLGLSFRSKQFYYAGVNDQGLSGKGMLMFNLELLMLILKHKFQLFSQVEDFMVNSLPTAGLTSIF